jgi:hypothetical protein
MELKDFIQRTLEDIVMGVTASQRVVTENGAAMATSNTHQLPQEDVCFDIAVTTASSVSSATDDRIEVVGGLASEGRNDISETSSVSRIKFKVKITFPPAYRKDHGKR